LFEPVPSLQSIYAVEHGDFIGQFFVFVETTKTGDYHFLSLPKMIPIVVPRKSFEYGVKNKVLVFVEKLPKPIYGMCQMQFKKNYKLKIAPFSLNSKRKP